MSLGHSGCDSGQYGSDRQLVGRLQKPSRVHQEDDELKAKTWIVFQLPDGMSQLILEGTDGMTCPVCMEPLVNPELPREQWPRLCLTNPCRHQFCTTCLTRWTEEHSYCPLCRQAIDAIVISYHRRDEK